MQKNKVFTTLGPVAGGGGAIVMVLIITVLQLPPDVAAMIKYHTLASHTYISKGRSCSFYINNIEIQCM